MSDRSVLAIIGGSALEALPDFVGEQRIAQATPWGDPSAPVRRGRIGTLDALYLARHGEPRAIAPHRVNYRANLHALHACGATHVLALATVGGIAAGATTGALWLPAQLIDYTWGREGSFGDGDLQPLRHIEFAQPYDQQLRGAVARAASRCGVELHDGGTYGCTQGPRLETAAEIRRLGNDGCDLVGMTALPEAALARELELPYASIALVVNRAAGLEAEPITLEAIERAAADCLTRVARIVAELARAMSA